MLYAVVAWWILGRLLALGNKRLEAMKARA
jgi:hypothetical protein